MAQSGRFGLGVRVLVVLAGEPEAMLTSAEIAARLGSSAVVVRRVFGALHKAGLIVQRKGPNGGAKLKKPAKEIGLGAVYAACSAEWPKLPEKALDGVLAKVRKDAVAAMDETSIAGLLKKMRKAAGDQSVTGANKPKASAAADSLRG